MKKIFSVFSLSLAAAIFITACSKIKDLPFYPNGNAVELTASSDAVVLMEADSLNEVLTLNWTSPKYATDSSTIKYLVQIDSAGKNFAEKTTLEVKGALSTSFTGRQLNNILLDHGFAVGGEGTMEVKVISSYSNNNEQYTSNVLQIKVTPYGDASVLTASQTSITCALITTNENAIDFNWTPSFVGYAGSVTYSIQYDSAGKDFANPGEIIVGDSIYTKSFTQGEINETAINAGIAGGTSGSVDYRIKSTTSKGATAYSGIVTVAITTYQSTLRFYMPGSYQTATGNGTDWTPANAPEMIRDTRTDLLNNMYYTYIYLPAGSKFKFTQGREWAIAYGKGATDGSLTKESGGDISVANDGFYRISININSGVLRYDVREGRMGFVGGATGAGWNPPNVFPNYALGNSGTNLFVGITDFTADGWKLIDNSAWDNGTKAVDETRSYGSTGATGSSVQTNSGNFPNITTAGRYRVIWDGRGIDSVKYEMYPADEMRMVGDGMQGVNAWDPPNSPQMTYLGNGQWQLTLALIAGKEFKFLAADAWGAFDYEDNSGGSNATGTPRKIKWEGGDNFKTPVADGTYTITLDENNQTVTVN